jgi:hypothetical protein
MAKDSLQSCERCVMDASAQYWQKTITGCNYCDEYLVRDSQLVDNRIEDILKILTQNSKGKKNSFDCLIGLSGGIDSSFALHQVLTLGLRPLIINLNNSWDSETAQRNIERLVSASNSEYLTEVLEWPKFRTLQKAMFESDIVDIEILTDQAIYNTIMKIAKKFKISNVITGGNHASEGLIMPPNWAIPEKRDVRLIKDINRKFGEIPNKSLNYPFYSLQDEATLRLVNGIKRIPILNYVSYNKVQADAILSETYGYQPFPRKHHESLFTRFYQNFILFEKHKIDKRKNHLSSLILSNQISRTEAIEDLEKKPYEYSEYEEDREFFLRKFQWTERELSGYLQRPGKHFTFYKNSQFRAVAQIKRKLRIPNTNIK